MHMLRKKEHLLPRHALAAPFARQLGTNETNGTAVLCLCSWLWFSYGTVSARGTCSV